MPNNLSVETEDWKPVQAQVPDYYQRGYPLEDIHDIVTGPDGSRIGQRSLGDSHSFVASFKIRPRVTL